jgi:hypothetical protein
MPGYDTEECDHAPESIHYRVMVGGYYIPVCRNAFEWAKKRGKIVSRGRGNESDVPFDEKIPSIRLNHTL